MLRQLGELTFSNCYMYASGHLLKYSMATRMYLLPSFVVENDLAISIATFLIDAYTLYCFIEPLNLVFDLLVAAQ